MCVLAVIWNPQWAFPAVMSLKLLSKDTEDMILGKLFGNDS